LHWLSLTLLLKVVKQDILNLAYWADLTGAFVTDENGVVIIAREKRLEMKALADGQVMRMSSAQREDIYLRDDFPVLQIEAWPDSQYPNLRRFEEGADPYVFGTYALPEEKLQVYIAQPVMALARLENDFQRVMFLLALSGSVVIMAAAGGVLYLRESRQVRYRLRDQRDQLNEAQRLAQMGSWSWDVLKNQTVWSDQQYSFYSRDGQQPTPTFDRVIAAVHPDDRERVAFTFTYTLEHEDNFDLSFRIADAQGDERILHERGSVQRDTQGRAIRVVGTTQDITERRRQEDALASANERTRAKENQIRIITENLPVQIGCADANGCLQFCNKAFAQSLGQPAATLIGLPLITILGPLYEEMRDYIRRAQAGETVSFERSAMVDGVERHFESIYLPAVEQDGRINGFYGLTTDVTARHRADRLKSEFIATVSHELRTPVTSIRGSLGLLEAGIGGELPEKALSLVKIANRNSRRLVGLVNDILDMEKLMAGKLTFNFQAVELVSLLLQAQEANAAYAEGLHVHLVLAEHPDKAFAHADPDRLMQVMANLLSNAAKFSPAEGQVDIALQSEEHDGHACWRIDVRDRGPGIPESFRTQIFGTFEQADNTTTRQKGGTGLGLNIAKSMVERMGGKIGFDSEVGCGTTFWFSLPKL
jgi:PAS domain S-box-containing protein